MWGQRGSDTGGWLKLHSNKGFFGSDRLQLAEISNLITV